MLNFGQPIVKCTSYTRNKTLVELGLCGSKEVHLLSINNKNYYKVCTHQICEKCVASSILLGYYFIIITGTYEYRTGLCT